MAKITIAGDSIVITSSKTLAAIKDLEKYRPKALRLYERDEDGNWRWIDDPWPWEGAED